MRTGCALPWRFQKLVLGFMHCWWRWWRTWGRKLFLWPSCRTLGKRLQKIFLAQRKISRWRKRQNYWWIIVWDMNSPPIFWVPMFQATPGYCHWCIRGEMLTRPYAFCFQGGRLFLTIAVPYVYIGIFTSWDNMLTIRSKTCRYLICWIS